MIQLIATLLNGSSNQVNLVRILLLVPLVTLMRPHSAQAQTPILIEGHVDFGVIYVDGQLSWRINADGATSEGNGPGDLVGLYQPSQLYVRVPNSMRFESPPFPGNPNVTGVGSGPFWLLPSSGGLPNVPFPGWSWDMGLTTPPQINLSQWQNGRIRVELLNASMPTDGNFSNWVGGTNYLSTFNPSLTNAANVPPGSNSFNLPGHDHFNWGFTRAGIYDVTVLATGTHLVDGFKSAEATFRFLVGDETLPSEPAQVVGAYVYHSAWAGQGDAVDTSKSLALEGSEPHQLNFDNLINTAQGINGLVFDVHNLAHPSQISTGDFEFQWSPVGAYDPSGHPPGNWQIAPDPSSIQVSGGAPSRILLQWPNGTIMNRWLRLTLKSTATIGLESSEVYYIGHLLGKTTVTPGDEFAVSFADVVPIRSNVGQVVDSSSTIDIDKSGTVSFGDISAMRGNIGTQLPRINVP